ncbi:MAG: polyprenyl synthetase family protein [Clostridium sp.]|jgi:geranylgeranyl pyrophosphate synthase|nr:polyprenyl synthetase family protein [Clostridium sp.]
MDFERELEAKIALIERALEQYLTENAAGEQALAAALRHSVSGGGKRIRPVLTLAFTELCGGDTIGALPFALAVELVHSYSLVHDDLPCMDNADTRRGMPSVHKAFGEATALLAGDALLTEAFSALSSFEDGNRVAAACRLLSRQAGARDGMVFGQMLELSLEGEVPGQATLQAICEGKTAALLDAACRLGVLASPAAADVYALNAAKKYGRCVGLAFQMIDDIFDLEEDSAAGRTSFATLLGKEKTLAAATELTAQAIEALDYYHGDRKFLRELAQWLLDRKK